MSAQANGLGMEPSELSLEFLHFSRRSRRWALAFCRFATTDFSPRMRATRIKPRAKRAYFASATLGLDGIDVEPPEGVTEVRLLKTNVEARSIPADFERPLRGLLIPSGGPRVSLAKNARFTLGFIRVARVAGLGFLRLRGNVLLSTKPEKCMFPLPFAVIRPSDDQ
jgi:hypothetical protein